MDPLLAMLSKVAPGTVLREALDNVLRAHTGALLVLGDSPEVLAICEGGFRIDVDLTTNNLYELAKMDGAIILTEDSRRILYANTQLVPDSTIPSQETGIRHRTAERVARQTGKLVVAISQRRSVITLFAGSIRYALRDSSVTLNKANQALATLEKYKAVFDAALADLSALELENRAELGAVAVVLQRAARIRTILRELYRYTTELGTDGRLVTMQLQELTANFDSELDRLIRDYRQRDVPTETVLHDLDVLSSDQLLDPLNVLRILGYTGGRNLVETVVQPRGYRLLAKIARLPSNVVDRLVDHFGSLSEVESASVESLDEVEGIGEVRARAIREGLGRLRERIFFEQRM